MLKQNDNRISIYAVSVIKFLVAVAIFGSAAFGLWYFVPQQITPEYALYGSLALSSLAIIMAFVLYHTGRDVYIAYGAGFAGITLLYASLYYGYITYALMVPQDFFWGLTVVALIAGYIAIRFHGRLLAICAVIMGVLTPAIVVLNFSRFFLAWYFVLFLFIVMLVSYYRRWFELPLLAFVGFLAYNPFLFSYTNLEGAKGFLSIYQVLDFMVLIFGIYTLIPWFYSLCCSKKRIFEAISLSIAGAYTAAVIHFVIESQLSLVAQLPFFIRYFVGKDVPVMNDVYMYIFSIYGLIYGVLFLLLFVINRHAKVTLGALACLLIICSVGYVYMHAKATGVLPTVFRAKKIVEQAISQVKT
jgi:hypothetical protein